MSSSSALALPLRTGSRLFPYTTLFRSSVDRLQRLDRLGVGDQLVHHDRGLRDAEAGRDRGARARSEEHTSELSHTVISYAAFCLKKKTAPIVTSSLMQTCGNKMAPSPT